MRRSSALTIAAAAALAVPAAQAMHVDPHGLGQVLVFPYYTANGGNDTLIAITNSSANAKALKVRFHEGYDGRGVLDVNVYLPAHAQWSASVTSSGDDASPARLVASADVCTVPAAASASRAIDFSDASYAGANALDAPTGNADGAPTTSDRTREGHFDVFEMGEVTGNAHGSLDAIAAADCAALAAAWGSGGYWAANPSADLGAPAGGIYGEEYVVNVARGTMFGVAPIAIDGFASAVQHGAPGASTPDLDSATPTADGRYEALVVADGTLRDLFYADPVDAVSALFMTDGLRGDFIHSASLGALTDWIVTAPTKRFYVDPARIGIGHPAEAPFEHGFAQAYIGGRETVGGVTVDEWGSAFPYACEKTGATAYARDGSAIALGAFDSGGPVDGAPPEWSNPAVTPCLETSVFSFATLADSQNIPQPLSALGSELLNATDGHSGRNFDLGTTLLPEAGSVFVDFAHDAGGTAVEAHRLAAAANGDVLVGLPVVAFAATTFVNGNVADGVLSNYSGSVPVRGVVTCVNGAGACR
jgi:hypothetical protein